MSRKEVVVCDVCGEVVVNGSNFKLGSLVFVPYVSTAGSAMEFPRNIKDICWPCSSLVSQNLSAFLADFKREED